ncbi:lactate utilization protein C [Alicyclobacillus sp. SO9]|uniref:LutC/YkgG family protein n=1 Tax=Alicyclobacillus sp. SO9 TaxID=2665646 RepID=UPI0018E6EEC8|nr:lactate utilization protein C [Alicyclobacillus sp. SO9]QQE77877.1 lactate utilization protein C [Alicyclobacillus sp. SO9]
MNETDFFANISKRLGRDEVPAAPPARDIIGAPEFWKSYKLENGERLQTFRDSLEKLGAHVQTCRSSEELQGALQDLLASLSPKRMTTWSLDELTSTGLSLQQLMETLQPYELSEWGETGIEDAAEADVGLTGCMGAVADTGTLVLMSSSKRGRSVSLLPSVHIAVVRASQVRTRLGEVMEELSAMEALPSSVHFISGPSRSSDIENDQSIGVHGPAAVYVLVYDDLT